MRSPIRLLSLALFVFLAVSGAASQTGGDSTQVVPTALSLRGVGTVEFDAIVIGRRAYLPMVTIFRFLSINAEYNRAQTSVEGFFLRGETRYRIDGPGGTATVGDKSEPLTSADYVARPGDFYLREELFESLFGLKLKYNPRRVEVTLETKLQLPVFVERARESARRRRFSLGKLPTPDYTLPRSFVPIGFGRLDYALLSQLSQHGIPRYSYSVHSGSQLIGGDLDMRLNGVFSQPVSFDDFYGRLKYAFLGQQAIHQLIFGDITALGLLPTNVFGVEITNRPAPRRYFFAEEDLDGNVPVGSIADLYMGGALVDYQRTGNQGQYSFSSMLTYGVTQFDVHNFDTLGLESRTQYHLVVPPTMIPPGEVQYDVIGGKIHPLRANEYYGNGVVQWGVNSRLTIGLGVDYYDAKSLSLPNTIHPTLTATSRLTQLLIGDFVFSPTAFSRGQLSLTFPSTAGASLSYTRYAHHPYYNPRDAVEEIGAAFSVPYFGRGYRISLDVLARQTIFTFHRERLLQASLSGQFGIFTPRITHHRIFYWQGLPNDPTIDAVTTLSVGVRAPAQFLFRGTTSYYHYDHGFRNLRLELSKRFSRQIWLQIYYDRNVITRTSIGGIQFVYYFPFTLLRTIVGVGGGVGYRVSQSVSGSIGYSAEAKDFYLEYLSNRVGFGGVVIQPFVDANGNGIQDPGEESITKATIRTRSISGSQYLRYSPQFGFTMRHTLPYEEYVMSIDQRSLDNPLWVPRYNNFAVVSEPNEFRQVQLPVVVGGVVRGRVDATIAGQTGPAEGIDITIQSEDSTVAIPYKAIATTYSTGEYEFIAVPPGKYIVSMNEKMIGDLGYKTTQLSHAIEVQVKPEGDEINDVNFSLLK